MSKKLLILSQKNNSRSIIAHALLKKYFKDITTYSAGLSPAKQIDPNAIKILKRENLLYEDMKSTDFALLKEDQFDLVLVLCEKITHKLPSFSPTTSVLFLEYDILEKSNFSSYEQVFKDMKMELIPIIRMQL